jgi:hypothetical protein
MAAKLKRIRAALLYNKNNEQKAHFIEVLQHVCETAAHLQTDMMADVLWVHVWQKIRFTGFTAKFVSEHDIPSLTPFFKDFQVLSGPEWHIDPNGNAHPPRLCAA